MPALQAAIQPAPPKKLLANTWPKCEHQLIILIEIMVPTRNLNIIGIMTGNSLDGVDLVLTSYNAQGEQRDLLTHSLPTDPKLRDQLSWLREKINAATGDVKKVAKQFNCGNNSEKYNFDDVSEGYINFIAAAVQQLRTKAENVLPDVTIDLIGFHGQTCAHYPPSVAKSKDPEKIYTVQVGDGQRLADLTGIPVVFDFRSDDLMNLGEAAPLAPVHHQHLAQQTREHGHFPIAFCNAGNTGNITIITEQKQDKQLSVIGWDTGPFNHYPDKLMQLETQQVCDQDGKHGRQGKVNLALLERLFNDAVITEAGENFLLKPPPRSSDPQWYQLLPELTGAAAISDAPLGFADRLRTAEYFSAYIFFHSLAFVPESARMPGHFAVCGGGWKNPIAFEHFKGLINGDFLSNPVLPQHADLFKNLQSRIRADAHTVVCETSEFYGFDGTAMEARIFADAAFCRITGEPFSLPSTTGVSQPTVAGIIRFPGGSRSNCSDELAACLQHYNTLNTTLDRPDLFDGRWSRAAAGWNQALKN